MWSIFITFCPSSSIQVVKQSAKFNKWLIELPLYLEWSMIVVPNSRLNCNIFYHWQNLLSQVRNTESCKTLVSFTMHDCQYMDNIFCTETIGLPGLNVIQCTMICSSLASIFCCLFIHLTFKSVQTSMSYVNRNFKWMIYGWSSQNMMLHQLWLPQGINSSDWLPQGMYSFWLAAIRHT